VRILVAGCGGIGSAVVRRLVAEGHEVEATYCNDEEAARCLKRECGVLVRKCNWAGPGLALASLYNLRDKANPFDAVVWTPGVVYPAPLREMRVEDALETMEVNFWGPYCLLSNAKLVLPHGGKIVFLSSSTGLRPSPGLAVYAASKAALNSLILSAAEELIEDDIRVYNLCLGRVATPLRRKIAPEENQSKIMQPEQVAKVVAFILSEAGDALSMFPVRVHMGPYV